MLGNGHWGKASGLFMITATVLVPSGRILKNHGGAENPATPKMIAGLPSSQKVYCSLLPGFGLCLPGISVK